MKPAFVDLVQDLKKKSYLETSGTVVFSLINHIQVYLHKEAFYKMAFSLDAHAGGEIQ